MITNEVIKEVYKKYSKKPSSPDCLDFALLFEKAGIMHDILVDPETSTMTVGSVPEGSLFHKIDLDNIYAIVPFEQWTAIVFHSSILFLHHRKPLTSIHIKEHSPSFWEKLLGGKLSFAMKSEK